MTAAATSSTSILDTQLQTLRAELKQWQRAFAATHGRAPTKDDIKREPFVAAKYKEYDRLRRPVEQRERRYVGSETPRKGNGHRRSMSALTGRDGNGNRSGLGTPTGAKAWKSMTSLGVVQEEGGGGEVEGGGEAALEQTPAFIRNALGPTPQRDGMVLGIFDGMPAATPCKPSGTKNDVSLGEGGVAATPSKSTGGVDRRRIEATPQSSSKRRLLDAFISTPLKRKRDADAMVETPSSTRKAFATPAFLRRNNWPMAPLVEEEDGTSTVAGMGGGGGSMRPGIGRRKKGLVRSLSSIIQNLRKQEEERMEEEWDVLNEIEADAAGIGGGGETQAIVSQKKEAEVVVEDGQVAAVEEVEMPLGPDQDPLDDGHEYADEGEEITGRKPWKKKGQKRTTKRVNMKPVLHKPKKAADLENNGDTEGEVDGAAGSDDEDDGNARAGKARKTIKDVKATTGEEKDTRKKKKISATAHANFRTLKIQNKNSKAKGRGGRFGRR